MITTILTILLVCLGVFAAVHIVPFIIREIAADIYKKKKTDVVDASNPKGIPKMSDDPRTAGSTDNAKMAEDTNAAESSADTEK